MFKLSTPQMQNADLVQLIRETIHARGPTTFAWFMEQALYHPAHGYYSSGRATIGRRGDYFTSVSVGPLFGRLLAEQFVEMWEALGRVEDFTIVEQGAHGGEFARDVLEAARKLHPDFFSSLRYCIVEPFPVLQKRQADALAEFEDKTSWRSALEDVPPFRGVHFSNELLDAMPLHLLRWNGQEWRERHLTEKDDGGFDFVDLPLANPRLQERLRFLPPQLPPGYETELNLAALDWIQTLADRLTDGYALVVDYGWARDEYYAPHRQNGTLRCRARHRVVPVPFAQAGHADITAHVDWTSVAERALSAGFELAGFTDQHHFLAGLLAGERGDKFAAAASSQTKRALQTLMHPQHLGMRFQYLCLAKKVALAPRLSGFRFARHPANALGLESAWA